MGAWGVSPWDNDAAADWFGDLFDATKLADKVEEALQLDAEDSHEEIRAAAAMVVMLGRVYIWPIEKYDQHLELAVSRLKELRELEIYQEAPEFLAAIDDEIALLQARLSKEKGSQSKGWSELWDRPSE